MFHHPSKPSLWLHFFVYNHQKIIISILILTLIEMNNILSQFTKDWHWLPTRQFYFWVVWNFAPRLLQNNFCFQKKLQIHRLKIKIISWKRFMNMLPHNTLHPNVHLLLESLQLSLWLSYSSCPNDMFHCHPALARIIYGFKIRWINIVR